MSDVQVNIGDKVWKMAGVLKHAGVAFTDYVAQLTYLLFLKMEDENRRFYGDGIPMPDGCSWQELLDLDGSELVEKYEYMLATLSVQNNILGVIFHKARNLISMPVHLRKVIDMIARETWLAIDTDVKGQIYESILAKNASSEKGAGQYFTPRALIRAIVDVMQPGVHMKIHDPFCGTGGFLLGAYEYIRRQKPDTQELLALKKDGITGNDFTPLIVSLCSMNMYLHGIFSVEDAEDKSLCPIQCCDTLRTPEERAFDMILANPPFGTAANVIDGEKTGELTDDRYFATTSNTQLNALQHIMAVLKNTGRAAVVLPDNVLFESGAGEKIRKRLLEQCNLHTILRLPCGIFYAHGVKANVLFFDRCPLDNKTHHTDRVWVYDYRTNIKHTLKQNPLKRENLDDFVTCYCAGNLAARQATWSEDTPDGRWRSFSYEEIIQRDKTNLDIKWLKDDMEVIEGSIPELMQMLEDELAKEQAAFAQLQELLKDINL